MANFLTALNPTLVNEGGYVLHKVKHDRGGLTYAGISEKAHPNWEGWVLLEEGNEYEARKLVADFYRKYYWNRIKGDEIESQEVANLLFDTAVNMGVRTASKMAQLVIGVKDDGVIGRISIVELNKFTLEEWGRRLFVAELTVAKTTRATLIVKRRPEQRKFYFGWNCRYLGV